MTPSSAPQTRPYRVWYRHAASPNQRVRAYTTLAAAIRRASRWASEGLDACVINAETHRIEWDCICARHGCQTCREAEREAKIR